MMVPQSRLLIWTGLVAVPAAAAATTSYAPARVVGAVVLGGLLVAAVLDAVWGATVSNDLRAELPAVTRLAKDRPGNIRLRLINPTQKRRSVRVGVAWPAELRVQPEDWLAVLPAATEHSELTWNCVPRRRGR